MANQFSVGKAAVGTVAVEMNEPIDTVTYPQAVSITGVPEITAALQRMGSEPVGAVDGPRVPVFALHKKQVSMSTARGAYLFFRPWCTTEAGSWTPA